jgi:hypothetical protein
MDVRELKGIDVAPASRQPSVDDPARAAAKKEFEDAKEQLRVASENHDFGQEAVAKERIRRVLDSVGDPSSRSASRELPNDEERIRTSVAAAIRAALEEIAPVHPGAHRHLVDSLVSPSGKSPAYRPSREVTWQVNLTATDQNPPTTQPVSPP